MRAAARFRKTSSYCYMWGCFEVARPRLSEKDRPAPNRAASQHRPAGLSVGTGLTGAMAAPAASRLPLASSNKFDQYGNPNTGTKHPSYQAVSRGCQRGGAGRVQPSGGLGVQPPAKEPPVGGGPVGQGGRQKREARHCLFHYPPAGGLDCIELRSIW
jgi:hypothetical protein